MDQEEFFERDKNTDFPRIKLKLNMTDILRDQNVYTIPYKNKIAKIISMDQKQIKQN